jgi:selenocysteine-specific elongation factor
MRVVGTAGHVDHGKSTLVTALTGMNPDRLKEEQAREMTIELGFAWLDLPNGEQVGIVDVPGHRDFIENMLAGVGGIDAALFVVAADEGVMPQTREHLAILDLLQIQGGVIVLSKADLIDDPDWFDLVEGDVRQAVRGTVLQGVPLVRVSARSGQGLAELKARLAEVLAGRPARPDLGRPRLPIDRVFTIPGFGTVVTGTLADGRLRLGEEIEILPGGLRGRVRSLQTHKKKEDLAIPGSRTAVNISGIDVDQVRRGDVLAQPGKYQPTRRVDVHFRLLPDASVPLQHSSEVKFFTGSAEVLARARLLGVEELRPGEEGWLQLELNEAVVAVRGDRYILRRPSPGETLGGGVVMDPQPAGRHKRFDATILARLAALLQGTPADILLQAALAAGPSPARDLATRARLPADVAAAAFQELVASGELLVLEAGRLAVTSDLLVTARIWWELETQRALAEIGQYHLAFPLRRGMPREELKSRRKLEPRLFTALLRLWLAEGDLVETRGLLARPDHAVRPNPAQQAQVARLLARFAASPYAPPTVKECQAELGEELYAGLIELGELVQVSVEVVFRKTDYEGLVAAVRSRMEQNGTLTLAEFRDQFQTSRKYAQAFLEHLDAAGLTQREGDARILRKPRT